MDRRNLLVRSFGFLSYAAMTSSSIAQNVSPNSVDVATFADKVRDQNWRNQIFIDVAFVHSWRSVLAPRGYKDESWAHRASENRNVVWQGLEQNAAEVIFKSSNFILEYEKVSFEAYLKNKDDFGSFLNSLGISGDGRLQTVLFNHFRNTHF